MIKNNRKAGFLKNAGTALQVPVLLVMSPGASSWLSVGLQCPNLAEQNLSLGIKPISRRTECLHFCWVIHVDTEQEAVLSWDYTGQ